MDHSLTIETDLFNHREVKPNFINPCCFGEDFAVWLKGQLAGLSADGFELSDVIQEDYGWGLWATRGKDPFWISLGFCGEGPTEEPGQWIVSSDYDPGLSLTKRLFHKPDKEALAFLRARIWHLLRSTPGIRVIDDEDAG
jgi:hypothetical protein